MHPNYVGALLNSALYLLSVFVAGLVTAHPLAWKLAIVAFGVTFLSHVFQLEPRLKSIAAVLVVLSWLLAAPAGLALFF